MKGHRRLTPSRCWYWSTGSLIHYRSHELPQCDKETACRNQWTGTKKRNSLGAPFHLNPCSRVVTTLLSKKNIFIIIVTLLSVRKLFPGASQAELGVGFLALAFLCAVLAKHTFRFLTFSFHQGNWSQNIALVGLNNESILNHFIDQKMNFFELIHDIQSRQGRQGREEDHCEFRSSNQNESSQRMLFSRTDLLANASGPLVLSKKKQKRLVCFVRTMITRANTHTHKCRESISPLHF